MNRPDLVDRIKSHFIGLNAKDMEACVSTILSAVSTRLAKGERVEIRGFGSFWVGQRPPRIGRNPRTGVKVSVPAKYTPRFKPGTELRQRVCAGYFEALGFRAKVAREGADGGVDIQLYVEGSERPGMIVQCKAWKTYKVGIKPLRELFGVMAADGVGEGAFVTTGTYTHEAREFATGKNLHLIDGADLLGKITALTHEQQDALLKTATSGDFTTPTCPSCGIKMTTRISKSDSDPFWGCVNYPRCRSTLRVARS